MLFLFLQIRCKFSDSVQFTVSTSVRRETGSACQNNSVKSGITILQSCEFVNRLLPIVDGLHVGKCRVTSIIGEQKSFPTLVLSYRISQVLAILSTSRRRKQAYPPLTSPKQCCVTAHATCSNKRVNIGRRGGGGGGGGGRAWGMVQIVCCMFFRTLHLATVSAVNVFLADL